MEKQIQEILEHLENIEARVAVLEGQPKQKEVIEEASEENAEDLGLGIANKTTDCDESEFIQTKVLDGRSVDAKVLMCFYISNKYFGNAWLTSGDVQRITAELGVKIAVGNASNAMKKLRTYLETGKVRKKGSPTPCRLNRIGVKRFEEILNG
jgi:hypothetical protein